MYQNGKYVVSLVSNSPILLLHHLRVILLIHLGIWKIAVRIISYFLNLGLMFY